jgi:hypothetical protein
MCPCRWVAEEDEGAAGILCAEFRLCKWSETQTHEQNQDHQTVTARRTIQQICNAVNVFPPTKEYLLKIKPVHLSA